MRTRFHLGLVFSAALSASGASAEPIPSASSSATLIYFASDRSGGGLGIYTIQPGGGDPTLIVEPTTNRGEYHPHLSPDGRRLSVNTYRYGGWKVATMNLDGSNTVRLSVGPRYAYDADWAPDGSRLVMNKVHTSEPPWFQGNREIFSTRPDGSDEIQLTDNGGRNTNPSFSPDGRKVLWDTFREDNFEVHIMDPDGANEVNITQAPSAHDVAPSWSPDGERIAFLRADGPYLDLWVMNADGSEQTNVTRNAEANRRAPSLEIGDHWKMNTSWSPDGTRVVFSSNMEGNWEIYVVGADGSGLLRLTNDPAEDLQPHWASDSNR